MSNDVACYSCDSEHVTITVSEYERLQGDSRKLRAIRDYLDEYVMKRKLFKSSLAAQGLRRVLVNKIQLLLNSRV